MTRAILPCDAEGISVPPDQVSQIGMRDLYPFGNSGRSRGVDHIGKALRIDGPACHSGAAAWPQHHGRDLCRALCLQAIKKRCSCHENRCARVFHGKTQTRIWPSGIQRYICGASAHDAESSNNPVQRPFHADGHSAARHDAKLRQISRKLIGPAIKLLITQLPVAMAQCN